MQKTGIIIACALAAILAAGGFIYSQISYKFCFGCDADGFYNRGLEYACSSKQTHRQTGLEFIKNAADQGQFNAELTLAELYSSQLPSGYVLSNTEQKECFQQDVAADQSTGMSYFSTVVTAIEEGQKVDPVILDNLALLYLEGVLSAEDNVDKAGMLYEKAAAEGSFPAMVQLGVLADARGEYPKALQWFIQASENTEDASSPLMVADYYRYGRGTDQDYIKAKEWYSKALARAVKAQNDEQAALANTAVARLDMVNRKLAEYEGKQRITINYRLEGGVNHFIVFAADRPEQPLGEVINNNGAISAVMNDKLELAQQPEPSSLEDFSSMIEGMQWVLTTYAKSSNPDAPDIRLDFVLTKS